MRFSHNINLKAAYRGICNVYGINIESESSFQFLIQYSFEGGFCLSSNSQTAGVLDFSVISLTKITTQMADRISS